MDNRTIEQLQSDKRLALAALRQASLALEGGDIEAAKRYTRKARKQLTDHQ